MTGILLLAAAALLLGTLAAGCSLVPGISRHLDSAAVRRALVYGVGDYHQISDLSSTVNDAREIHAVLQHHGFASSLVLDFAATKQRILDDISALALEASAADVLLFYFSGHGDGYLRSSSASLQLIDPAYPSSDINYQGQAAIVPNTEAGAPPLSESDLIFAGELLDALSRVPGRKLIIVDTCHGGGMIPESGSDIDGLPDRYGFSGDPSTFTLAWEAYFSPAAPAPYPDIWVISSAGAHELAYENLSIGNGYFTYFLLAALGYDHEEDIVTQPYPADRNGDGLISVSELYWTTFQEFDRNYNFFRSSFYSYYSHLSGGPSDLILVRYGD